MFALKGIEKHKEAITDFLFVWTFWEDASQRQKPTLWIRHSASGVEVKRYKIYVI